MLVSGPVATSVSAPGSRPRRGEDRVDRVRRRGVVAGFGQLGVAEAACAVEPLASLIGRSSGAAQPGQTGTSGRRASASTARVLRVALAEIDVAVDGRNADQLGARAGAGVEQRESVVDAGVDVDDQRRRAGGHGVSLPWSANAPHRLRPRAASIDAARRTSPHGEKPRRSRRRQRTSNCSATAARPKARPIHRPRPASGVKKARPTPTGAPIAQ